MKTPNVDACVVYKFHFQKSSFSDFSASNTPQKKWKLAFQKYKLSSNSFFKIQLSTPGHKPGLFFPISWAFSFFCKIFAFCPHLSIFFPVKAECSYFSNFIMCAPARAHARVNFTLNVGNSLKILKSKNFEKIWFWRARVRAGGRALTNLKSMDSQLSLEKNY